MLMNIILKKTISFLIFLTVFFSSAQNIELISNTKIKDSTKILFSKSFDNDPLHFVPKNEYRYFNGNKLEVFFPLKSIGIFQIESEGINSFKATLICEEKDSVKIDIDEKEGKLKLKFEGSNSDGIDLINNSKLFTGDFYFAMSDIFSKSISSDEVLSEIDKYKTLCFYQLDELFKQKKISLNFLDFTKRYFETEIVSISNLYLYGFVSNDYPYPTKLTDGEIAKTIQEIDKKYNIFSKTYNQIRTNTMFYALVNKCLFIEKGILKGKYEDFGLWKKNQIKYNFAPKSIQEFIAYHEITKNDFDIELYKRYTKVSKGIYYQPLFGMFKEYHPTSTIIKPNILISLKNNKNIEILKQNQYKSISELIVDNYKGKAVFVDIWATWCAPCKLEFKFNNELENFLISQNISLLYLTVDNLKAIKKWEDFIVENKIVGNHYFPDDAFKENLKKKLEVEGLNIPVPRYLLFNSNGQLILRNAKRPSQKEELYEEISNAL